MQRALLLQLPAPGFRWPLLDANIPLAAGYLAAWCAPRLPRWQVDVADWQTCDLLGDAALLRHILSQQPDLVGFSIYCWNVERSLALGQRLRAAGVPVVFGGPEASPDNPLLPPGTTGNTWVAGEGEEALRRLLQGRGVGGRPPPPLDLHQLPSPYLTGVLPPAPDGSLWLETVRGCPFRCSYCNYGKGARGQRRFPDAWLPQHLRWAAEHGVGEVYLMDPSFNVRPDWEPTLQCLEQHNTGGQLRFHTELVADALRPGDAARLAGAGLASCELGLQSIHPAVLDRVGRPWDEGRWRAGVGELLGAGVASTVGLILGLPGDSPAGFRASVGYLLEQFPAADIQVFPLACLPGTTLRDQSAEFGLEHLELPPYTVTAGGHFATEELSACLDWFEEATGLEMDPVDPPNLSGRWDGGADAPYWSGIQLDAPAAAATPDWPERVATRAAHNLTLWCRGWHGEVPRWLAALAAALPHGVLTLVLDDGAGWPPERLAQLLAAGSGNHYLDRSHSLLYGPGARLVPRLAVLVAEGDRRAHDAWLSAVRCHAEVIWRLAPAGGWADTAVELVAEGETVLVTAAVEETAVRQLADAVGTEARGVLFAGAEEQALWDALTGRDGFHAPEHRASVP